MRPASISQNAGHGVSLRWFYEKNNLIDGDEFYVPIISPNSRRVPVSPPLPLKIPEKPKDRYKIHLPNFKTYPSPRPIPVFPIIVGEILEYLIFALAI